MDRFELDLSSYLNAHAAGEFRNFNMSQRWSIGRSIGHVSLLLATLASGAHYSDMEHPQRSEICQELGRSLVDRCTTSTNEYSSSIVPGSATGKFFISSIFGHHSIPTYPREHPSEQRTIGCCVGTTRNNCAAGPDSRITHEQERCTLACAYSAQSKNTMVSVIMSF